MLQRFDPILVGEFGDVLRAGPSTAQNVPVVMLGDDGDLDPYGKDNIAVDQWGKPLPRPADPGKRKDIRSIFALLLAGSATRCHGRAQWPFASIS